MKSGSMPMIQSEDPNNNDNNVTNLRMIMIGLQL